MQGGKSDVKDLQHWKENRELGLFSIPVPIQTAIWGLGRGFFIEEQEQESDEVMHATRLENLT